jgi:hypothetical protein
MTQSTGAKGSQVFLGSTRKDDRSQFLRKSEKFLKAIVHKLLKDKQVILIDGTHT